METGNQPQPESAIPEEVLKRIKTESLQWQKANEVEFSARSVTAYRAGAEAEFKRWGIHKIHPVFKGWDSVKLIGRVRDRFAELAYKMWDWRSFYNGWLEGRSDMLREGKEQWDDSQEVRVQLPSGAIAKVSPDASPELLDALNAVSEKAMEMVDYNPSYEDDDIYDAVRQKADEEFRRSGLFQAMKKELEKARLQENTLGEKISELLKRLAAAESRSVCRWVKASERNPEYSNLVFFFKVVFEDGTSHMRHGRFRLIDDLGYCYDSGIGCYREEEYGKYIEWLEEIPADQYNDELKARQIQIEGLQEGLKNAQAAYLKESALNNKLIERDLAFRNKLVELREWFPNNSRGQNEIGALLTSYPPNL